MRIALVLPIVLALLPSSLPAILPPVQGSLTGLVTDTTGRPLGGVEVVIVEARRNALTDAAGRFRFVALPEGRYVATFHGIGYRPETRRVVIAGPTHLEVRMLPVRIELSALQVTATADAGGASQSPQPTSIVSTDAVRSSPAATLGGLLDGLPGVRSLTTGQGVGKPVIRGLTGNRVLVLDDGVRLENAQWGDEHGPQIETLDADRVEVIRGPASVLYGSDALGGVVNVVPRELPDALGRAPFVAGRASMGYASGSLARDGGVLVEGAVGAVGLRGSVVTRRADDVRTPRSRLFNSGLAATNLSAALGARGRWGHAALDVVHRSDRLEFPEDPADDPGATPYQRVREQRVRADAGVPMGAHRLEVKAAWEQNRRREFEADGDPAAALALTTRSLTGDVHFHHAPVRGWHGIAGLSLLRQQVTIGGDEVLVPASTAQDVGLLVFEQREWGGWQLSVGARLDARRLEVEANSPLGVAAQTRRWTAWSGNAGALVPLAGGLTLVATAGRGWRAPSAFELFANGVHEGTIRYEIGDPTLGVETSFNMDAALRLQSGNAQGEIGVFVNRIADFIHAQPTDSVDPGSGFQVFQHAQGDAVLAGVEASLHLHPTGWLELSGDADWIRGQNTAADRPLPQMPPLRVSGSARFERRQAGHLRHLHFTATGIVAGTVPTSRRDPDDLATAGYELVHLSAGAQLWLGAQLLSLDAGIRNVFDSAYRDFLSRTKSFADEMGRSAYLRVTAEF